MSRHIRHVLSILVLSAVTLSASSSSALAAGQPKLSLATVDLTQFDHASVAIDTRGGEACSLGARGPHHARVAVRSVKTHKRFIRWSWRVGTRAWTGHWAVSVRCGHNRANGPALKVKIRVRRGAKAHHGSRSLVTPGSLRVRLASSQPGDTFESEVGPGGKGSGCGAEGFDAGGYCNGQCTHYAWTRRPDLTRLGNAVDWLPGARARGIPTGARPAAGAIAWWDGRVGGGYGHVAYVESSTTTTVTISEMNWLGPFVTDQRTINLSDPRAPHGYIYGGPAGNGPGGQDPGSGTRIGVITANNTGLVAPDFNQAFRQVTDIGDAKSLVLG